MGAYYQHRQPEHTILYQIIEQNYPIFREHLKSQGRSLPTYIQRENESPNKHIVTEEEIIEFGTRWDSHPFHVDPEAAKNSVFGGLVASSTHLFSVSIGLWNNLNVKDEDREAVVSALGFNNMKLKVPARQGDQLQAKTTVIKKRDSNSRPDLGILVFRNEIKNQNDELVLVYESAVLYRKEA